MAKNKNQNQRTSPAIWEKFLPYAYMVGFFVLVSLSVTDGVKGIAVVALVLAFGGGFFGFSRLRDRFHLPMMALALFVAMSGVSTFYAISGKFALQEFLKVLISFCLAVFMLATVKGDRITSGRRIAFCLEGASALAGLVSIDLLSTRTISTAILSALGLFNDFYSPSMKSVEEGTRMLSIFENPNVFAGCVGIGVLLSLGLVLSSDEKKERIVHLVCLFVNALSFLLAFSMGATAFIAAAFIVYLLTERKERLGGLFVLMVETMITSVAAMAVIAGTAFDTWDGFQPVPLLCVVAGAAALCLLDRFVGQAVGKKLAAHSKALLAVIAVVLAAAVGLGIVAYNLTGAAQLQPGESMRRSVYPAPGTYNVSAQMEGDVSVTVESQNKVDTMMHTSTVLYQGALADASFTVPEDSMVVYLTFSATGAAVLDSVACVGGETVSVPLDYKLLPEFVANRLQGLWANQNAIQRTVFFEDGMKLFAQSPLFGLGLGCFETAIKSVQTFFYETKYAHNHYVQTLAEMGVVGLVLFIVALGTAAAAVVLELRKKTAAHPLTPALGAALVFIIGHAAMEVNFSFYAYLPFAFGVFALINLCCGETLAVRQLSVKVTTYALVTIGALVVVFSFFFSQNMSAANLIETAPSMDNLVKAAKMDPFENADYKLSYVVNATNFPDNMDVRSQADQFAAELAEVDSNTIPRYLAEYYFGNGYEEDGFAMIEKYLNYVSSDQNAWNQAFGILRKHASASDEYCDGLQRVVQLMETWNRDNLGKITLTESDRAFLAIYGY